MVVRVPQLVFFLHITLTSIGEPNSSMSPLPLLVVYCLLVASASLAGGWIPSLVRLTHTRMQLAISFVAGVMLGVGILHMLPHAEMQLANISLTAAWVLIGFMLMFFLQRFSHFHHHVAPEAGSAAGNQSDSCHDDCDHDRPVESCSTHAHEHAHGDAHHDHPQAERLSWSGAAMGLALHSTVDGMALAAAVESENQSGHAVTLAGVATFIAIILHKPFDSLTITTLMAAGGWSRRARNVVNAAYALFVPMGVMLFYFGVGQQSAESGPFIGRALAFAAGAFLCIATSDLLPEVQFHSHDRVKLSAALLLGVALAWAVESFAHGHDTEHHSHEHCRCLDDPDRLHAKGQAVTLLRLK
jgi:zinc and cadmium transporter